MSIAQYKGAIDSSFFFFLLANSRPFSWTWSCDECSLHPAHFSLHGWAAKLLAPSLAPTKRRRFGMPSAAVTNSTVIAALVFFFHHFSALCRSISSFKGGGEERTNVTTRLNCFYPPPSFYTYTLRTNILARDFLHSIRLASSFYWRQTRCRGS